MGRIPELVPAGEFDARLRDMKRRHNLFWEEVKEGFLVPRMDKIYGRPSRMLGWWTKKSAKSVAIQIVDMASDPLVITLFRDRYSLDVTETLPPGICFTVKVEKIALMNIGYGNQSPASALLKGSLKVAPLFPLRDKIFFWRLIGT